MNIQRVRKTNWGKNGNGAIFKLKLIGKKIQNLATARQHMVGSFLWKRRIVTVTQRLCVSRWINGCAKEHSIQTLGMGWWDQFWSGARQFSAQNFKFKHFKQPLSRRTSAIKLKLSQKSVKGNIICMWSVIFRWWFFDWLYLNVFNRMFLFQFNGVDLTSVTAEQAMLELCKPSETVQILAQYNPASE